MAQAAAAAIAGGAVTAAFHSVADGKARASFEAAITQRVVAVEKAIDKNKDDYRDELRDMRGEFQKSLAEMRDEFRAASQEFRSSAIALGKLQESQSLVNKQTTDTMALLVRKIEETQHQTNDNTMSVSLLRQWCDQHTGKCKDGD